MEDGKVKYVRYVIVVFIDTACIEYSRMELEERKRKRNYCKWWVLFHKNQPSIASDAEHKRQTAVDGLTVDRSRSL